MADDDVLTPGGRLRAMRKVRHLTVDQLAERSNRSQSTVRAHENGQNGIKPDAAEAYASVLKVAPEWILFGTGEPEADASPPSLGGDLKLAVRYEVGAGGFHERDELPQRPYGFHVVRAIPPYQSLPQWLERVVSDSMDRLIPVGSLLHVVDALSFEYAPRHGDIVIVQRTRAQGALVERTVKQVALKRGVLELWPRSHNDRWQGPVVVEGDAPVEDMVVEIVGLVLRSYQFFVGEPDEPEAA